MQERTITEEKKVYSFSQTEQEQILKRILKEAKNDLCIYWNYDDGLSEEQIINTINHEEGLNILYDEILFNNELWITEIINNILNEYMTEQEKTDQNLKFYLYDELSLKMDLNIKQLLKNSSIRLRIELNTNEEALYFPEYKKQEYYKLIRKNFKGVFKLKDLKTEIQSFIGSDYGKLIFYGVLNGCDFERFIEEKNKGFITIPKGIKAGFFNSWMGCGGYLDLTTEKEIKLNINNWTGEKDKGEYYNISIYADNLKAYGINEVYGLISECWKDL